MPRISKEKIFTRERNRWLIMLRRYENAMSRSILELLDTETKFFAENYNDMPFLRKYNFGLELLERIKKGLNPAFRFAIKTTETQINQLIKKQEFDYFAYLEQYLANNLFQEMIEHIKDNFYEELYVILQDGIRRELPRSAIQKLILDSLLVNKTRAERIARTETHKGAMYASETRAKDISKELNLPMLKQWIPVEDSRTRPAHSAMYSVPPIPINEMFVVGGEKMSRPNDLNASAKNVVQCRCVMRFIPQLD